MELLKKHQRSVLSGSIALCIVLIVVVGVQYGRKLQTNLTDNVVRDVMNMTLQRRQTFDKFIAEDRARLHSYAQYFSHSDAITKEAFPGSATMRPLPSPTGTRA